MAIPGVPWAATYDEIVEAIKKAKGRITYASKYLNVHPETLYRRMEKDPRIKEALDLERKNFDLTLLDAAENTLLYAISKQETDLNNALKSTFFILNNKGKERGYSIKNNPNYNEVSSDDIANFIRQIAENKTEVPRAESTEQSGMETQ